MEGITSEAASLAGHQKLGKLIVLYDDNHITIDGSTDLAFTEDVCARFAAYGWHVQRVADGDDVEAIDKAIAAAKAATGQPSLIAVRTHIGCGSPNKQDKAAAHGAPLGADEVKLTKEACYWPLEPAFFVADDVKAFYEAAARRGAAAHAAWRERHAAWRAADAARATAWDDAWAHRLPKGWDADLPAFAADEPAVATRSASGKVINAVAPHLPNLIGGSADLAPSNNTLIKDVADAAGGHAGRPQLPLRRARAGHGRHRQRPGRPRRHPAVRGDLLRVRRLHAAGDAPVRPHGPAGHLRPDPRQRRRRRRRPHPSADRAPRHAARHAQLHRPAPGRRQRDGRGLEDRPRGERRAGRPHADAPEPADHRPLGLRGGERRRPRRLRAGRRRRRGAPELILLASGSEVQHVLAAHERLAAEGVRSRVVNMASFRLFERQDAAYRESVLPAACRCRLAVEAAASFGWDRWVGADGEIIAIDRFGASAPAGTIFERFGFTADNVYTAPRRSSPPPRRRWPRPGCNARRARRPRSRPARPPSLFQTATFRGSPRRLSGTSRPAADDDGSLLGAMIEDQAAVEPLAAAGATERRSQIGRLLDTLYAARAHRARAAVRVARRSRARSRRSGATSASRASAPARSSRRRSASCAASATPSTCAIRSIRRTAKPCRPDAPTTRLTQGLSPRAAALR